jgi:hypothetical protein
VEKAGPVLAGSHGIGAQGAEVVKGSQIIRAIGCFKFSFLVRLMNQG